MTTASPVEKTAEPVGRVVEHGSSDAAAEPARNRKRNRSIDVLRGWAIALMISSHVGSASRVATFVNIHRWVDAAGPFVVLAGLVLGLTVSGGKSERAVWRRARELWVIHVMLMIVVVAIHEMTGKLRAPSVAEAGGIAAAAWKIATLRLQAIDYMNILPLFIVFFAMAPVVLQAMKKGHTGAVLAGSLTIWAVTQRYPGWLPFTDPASGPESFVLPAWQFPFVVGLATGFRGRSLSETFWPRHRSRIIPALVVVVGAVFVLAQLQRRAAARLHASLPESVAWIFNKETWGPGRAIYTLGMLLLLFVALEAFRRRRNDDLGAAGYLELMGGRSLYCFLVHLPLALLGSAVSLDARASWLQDIATLGAFVIVYQLARHRVLARYIPS